MTFERLFYHIRQKGTKAGKIMGWPFLKGPWCNDLKRRAIKQYIEKIRGGIQYVGIALDEPERLARLDGVTKISPLAAIGWTEADCRKWCEENNLLSPIYTDSARGGCWFCHNQGVDQLRLLRKNYPDLWQLMLKWDLDSPVSFKSDGKTVHDYEKRFLMEDAGLIDPHKRFLWKDVMHRDLSDLVKEKHENLL